MVVNVSSVAVLWFGANRIDSGDMQIGALIAFLTYLTQILMSVMMATFMAVLWPRAAVCAERINEVLDTPSSVVAADDAGARAAGARQRSSCATSGFHYPGAEEPVLADISFRCVAGQTTAIIGSTGSGKTTLLSLIPRLFDATAGAVLRRRRRRARPRPRGAVEPHRPRAAEAVPVLRAPWPATCATARPDATDDELWEALRIAQAADFVAAMPGGLDAPIAQGGANVSGGQRQRLAIARALVRKPEIYLFDDSFSALDLATDARLRAALAPHTADAAVVIVGQRVSTIVAGRPDPRARGRADRRPRHATTSCSRPARPTPRSSRRS